MLAKKNNHCRVGLATYNYDWLYGTGTEKFACELIRALINLRQSAIEYKVLLKPDVSFEQIGLPQEVCLNAPLPSYSFLAKSKRKIHYLVFKKLDAIRKLTGRRPGLRYMGALWIKEWLHSLDLDLLYFPSPWYHELIRDIPIGVHVFDMQHLYYPQFWPDHTFQHQTILGWFRDNASLVTCNFDLVADDLKKQLKVPAEKIATIFLAPPQPPSVDVAVVNFLKKRFNLPGRYFIYPAALWPHKNHLNLIRAIAQCISEGLEVFCVCAGEYADWLYPGQFLKIQAEIKRYQLEKYIFFTGALPYADLHGGIYALEQGADFFCIPTLYEAGCIPFWEAAQLGKAAACSDVTMIPYQMRDAGLLFNPADPQDIAKAIRLLWEDENLRNYLGNKAKAMINNPLYSFERTAQGYHRAFVHALIRLGKLPKELWIEEDPVPPLDRGPVPEKFSWRK